MTWSKIKKRKRWFILAGAVPVLLSIYAFAIRPFLQEIGATTYGPLSAHKNDIVLNGGQRLLAHVTSLENLPDDALRFVAMPSFGNRWIAVSLSKNEKSAVGKMAIFNRTTRRIAIRTFEVEEADYDNLVKRWDASTNSYWGELSMWTDGTPLGFERKRNGIVTAGIGNSPCHYAVLGNLAANYIGPKQIELLDLSDPSTEKLLESDYC